MSRKESGFTVIELLISTLVFSLILVGAMAALITLGRIYQNGVITTQTQEANRAIMAELSQSIQFSKQPVTPPSFIPGNVEIDPADVGAGQDTGFFCIGPRRYTYALDRQLITDSPNPADKEKRHVLWVDTPTSGCASATTTPTPADLTQDMPSASGRELMPESMRISKLTMNETDGVWRIELSLAHGGTDLLVVDPDDATRYECARGATAGSEFCAISELTTSVLRRLGNAP